MSRVHPAGFFYLHVRDQCIRIKRLGSHHQADNCYSYEYEYSWRVATTRTVPTVLASVRTCVLVHLTPFTSNPCDALVAIS